ncbi:hypothetical protein [Lihuaxuella thermophila]|nr:hypothetical protein [Lihuaxuella thermophila]
MTEKTLIKEEKTPYKVLLYRKNRTLRLLETFFFLLGFIFVFLRFEFRSPAMIAATLLLAVGVIFVVPAVYRVLFKPRYVLYKDKLVIEIGKKKESYYLTEIQREFDLPYFFQIKNKRTPLLVSDEFLSELNVRLEVIKRG